MAAEVKKVDLTGIWHGLYSYPEYLEPVFYVATLISYGENFSGTTHEALVGRSGAPLTVFAGIDGSRTGAQVSFRKTYDGSSGWTHSLMYHGRLSGDHNEIEGLWIFPDGWSGRFMMIRGTGLSESVVREVYERVQ
jgi:hypothetical protein